MFADSFAAGHASVYGYARPTTPFLEELAADAIVFDDCSSQTSWTLSSMISVFTGQAQETHGVLRSDLRLDDQRWVVAEALRERGYETVGFVQNGAVGVHNGAARGFDRYEVLPYAGRADEFLRRAGEYLRAPAKGPRFVYVHLAVPHMPYAPPEDLYTQFQSGNGDPTIEGSIIEVATVQHDERAPGSPETTALVDRYDGHVAYADRLIRAVVEAADAGAGPEGALLIVSSDHGEAFMEHGATGHNTFVYQEMVHVPLLVRPAPGQLNGLAGTRRQEPVSLLDLAPTLCHLLDVPGPPDSEGLALFDGNARKDLAARGLNMSSRYPPAGQAQLVQRARREGRWKLVVPRRAEAALLFDLEADPGETRDLAAEHPQRVARMKDELVRSLALDQRHRAVAGEVDLSPEAEATLRGLGYADYLDDGER